MILQDLNNYYERLAAAPEPEVPPYGFSVEKIHICITLDKAGNMAGPPFDLREGKTPKFLTVPLAVNRSSNVLPNFMWDNTGYVLGADDKGKPKRLQEAFQSFKTQMHNLGDSVDDTGMRAVMVFLDSWNPADAEQIPGWNDMAGCNIVFRLKGEQQFIHEHEPIKEAWLKHYYASWSKTKGMCLVTGKENQQISRIHAAIKGVPGAQSSGAAIVSFNEDAFTSYNKEQNFNAPVGERAAFGYTTALNHLLSQQDRRFRFGNTMLVYWAGKPSPAENLLGTLFSGRQLPEEPVAPEDKLLAKHLREFFESVRKQKMPKEFEDREVPFHVLGLSPNAARLSVRFWHVSTTGDILDNAWRHYHDMNIVKQYDNDPDCPPFWLMAREMSAQNKLDNFPDIVAGGILRAVITGGNYPQSMLNTVLGRIRADKNVNYLRAAMLKAFLARNTELIPEDFMSLDTAFDHPAYLLGRLFSILEGIQRSALGSKVNTTIRDAYYGKASASPSLVFPILVKKAQHHLKKIRTEKPKLAMYFDRLIGEIMDKIVPDKEKITAYPKHLPLEEQGLFDLGYYHQSVHREKNTQPEEETE